MNPLQLFIPTRLKRYLQARNEPNRKALREIKRLGFSPAEVRRALISINGVNVSALKDGKPISIGTLHNTINGKRDNPEAKEIIAEALGLKVRELFPKGNGKDGLTQSRKGAKRVTA